MDGRYHNSEKQKKKDFEKEKACEKFGITLVRLTNQEVFGDRKTLIDKLREGYRNANERMKSFKKE